MKGRLKAYGFAALTVAMPANALAGLAVNAQNATMVTTAVFSSVSVTPSVVPPPAPTVTALAPTSGIVGSSVVITGTNFGMSQGSSTVTFNGVQALPSAWSPTSLAVPVPVGATSGSVVVTVNGLATAPRTFTVLPTACVVTGKVAVVAPAATVTLAGTLATDELLLESVTTVPPGGAAEVSVAVPVEGAPPTTLGGFSDSEPCVGP